jgi:hypothetical protein
MSCRNWESGVVVRVGNRKKSSTVSASFSEGASASTKVKAAAETQARSSVQTGKASRQPDKGCDTSQQDHVQKQKQQQQQKDHLENTDVDMEMVFQGTVPIPMQQPGRRYRAGEEPWFYSMQG